MQKYASFRSASNATRLRLAIYYAQRAITSRTVRRIANYALIGGMRAFHRSEGLYVRQKSTLAEHLKKAGYIRLGSLLTSEQCEEILHYLDKQYMVDERGTGKRFRMHFVPDGVKLGDYPLDTVVNCPHVLEIANHPDIIRIMTNFIGFKPTIASLSLRWSFPTDSATDTVQSFHRDSEPGSAKLLIYLTDVDHLSGPHTYVEGTHRDRRPLRLRTYSDDEVMRKHGGGIVIKGAAGTGFAIVTRGIHKGVPPAQRPRLMLGIQYSLLPCFLYEYAPVKSARAAQFDPYINRLMITDEVGEQRRRMGAPNESDPELANSGR